tara:strand:- start:20415 stop:20633 length:219 start_codon:yes stop_codon:yes gene_type:complete
MVDLTKYKVMELRKFITGYNKIERKRTYSGIWKMNKNNLIQLINNDFKPNFRNNFLYLKHKSGRYTKRVKKK